MSQSDMAEGDNKMKKNIHPDYHVGTIKCSTCGAEFEIGTTVKDYKIDTCSNCHPFYTGTQTFVQATGRVERFNRRYGMKENQKQQEEEK